jgi:hypothetical protein
MTQTEVCENTKANMSPKRLSSRPSLTIDLPEDILSNIETIQHFSCYITIENTRIRKKYYVPHKWSIDKFITSMKTHVKQDLGENLAHFKDIQFVIKKQQKNSSEKLDHVLTTDLIYYVNELDLKTVYIRGSI